MLLLCNTPSIDIKFCQPSKAILNLVYSGFCKLFSEIKTKWEINEEYLTAGKKRKKTENHRVIKEN